MSTISFNLIKEYDEFIIASETDLKGIITYASQGFCEISGYTKEELIGKNHNIVRDPKNDSRLFEKIWDNLKDNKTVHIERLSNKNKSGEIYFTKAKLYPIFRKNEKIGYRSLRKDITDKVKLEQLYKKMLEKEKS
jgi:PAS domain S-box-containing protein